MIYDSKEIKNIAKKFGADLCGIATADRFKEAPKGYHPIDIYQDCKSVIVFAKKVPAGSLFAGNCIPYTHINNVITQDVDRLGIRISLALEEFGITAVAIPSDGPVEHWEPDKQYARAILSMRHSGYLSGLGVLGKNTLLINDKFGNMIQIGAILVDVELEPDPIATYEGCLPDCQLCLDSCPQNALDGLIVNQKLCRPLSNYVNEKGFVLKKCNVCRRICPHCLGLS
jgi:epoxyqueuosine reductase